MKKKFLAFTLAEILITTGIIGVVAAMTLPTLIANYNKMVLKNNFKRSYANLYNAYNKMRADIGFSDIGKYYLQYNGRYIHADEFYSEMKKHLNIVKVIPYANDGLFMDNFNKTNKIYNGSGEVFVGSPFVRHGIWQLADGSSLTIYIMNNSINFTIDTNGLYKKPNRSGYDIFTFVVFENSDRLSTYVQGYNVKNMSEDQIEEALENSDNPYTFYPCSLKSKQKINGISCALYALTDTFADKPTQKYWDNLEP